jgi:hypothetical protein
VTPTELEAYDAMMKDRDKWKSLYFTMRELSGNATEIAERGERENARLRESMQEAWKIINAMAGQEYWQRAEEWLEKHAWAKPKDMSNTSARDYRHQPEASVENKSNL